MLDVRQRRVSEGRVAGVPFSNVRDGLPWA